MVHVGDSRCRYALWGGLRGCLVLFRGDGRGAHAFGHAGQVLAHNLDRCSRCGDAAALQPDRPGAESLHVGHGMRHEQDRDIPPTQFMNLPQAPLAEVVIADRERFVHEQDVGLDTDGDSECEANHHA